MVKEGVNGQKEGSQTGMRIFPFILRFVRYNIWLTIGSIDEGVDMDTECRNITESKEFSAPQRSKTKCLVVLINAMAICGLIDGIVPDEHILSTFLNIFIFVFLPIMTLIWCMIDADEHNFNLSKTLSLLILLVYPIGFGCYILITRRNGPALMTLGLAFLFLIVLSVFYSVMYFVGNWLFGL